MRNPFGGLPREIPVLAAVAFAVAVGFGVAAPALPVFARDFGVGRAAAGAVVSAFAVMRLASALAGGRLVERLGERRVLAAGIGIVGVSSLLAGLAQSYPQLLVVRGVGGIGSAMFTVAAVSLVLRVAPPDQRGRASGLFQSGFLVGGIAGPAFGGPLAEVSLRLPFFVYAGTLAVAGAIGLVFLRHTPLAPARAAGERAAGGLGSALRSRAYLAALSTNLGLGWLLFGVRVSLLPLFVVEGMARDARWIGVGLVVSSLAQVAGLAVAGRVTDGLGRRPALVGGAALAAGSAGLLALSTSVTAYVAAMVVAGVGCALLGVAGAAVVGDVAGARSGTLVAAYQMAADFGTVVGPIVAGRLADEVSYAAAWGVTAALVAAGGLLAVVMPETRSVRGAGQPTR